MQVQHHEKNITLVLGGTGKTGRRIAERLKQKGKVVRIGSRSAVPAFDWNNEKTWQAAIDGVSNIYISYTPDLAMPGAGDAISALVQQAKNAGAKRLILLSGRGEDEAQACEAIVQNSGLDWTIVRASWFNQNFSEGAFIDMVSNGAITLPAGDTLEPFVDADDIADVAVAALTEDGHAGQVYEVTGPRLMTFADIAKALSQATGREINYTNVPHDDFIEGIRQSGAPQDVVWMLDYLFATVLDGRNAHVAYGVVKAIGRPAKDFADYARDAAASGCWEVA
ncbi:NAD(P)H-binding protein [Parasphingorhabdus sp.]|uniref:NAD(P)H-binding protein n=1 Tax=Parasphingorhabdus sp. TaxID=2709688 RepID=UPI003D26DE06